MALEPLERVVTYSETDGPNPPTHKEESGVLAPSGPMEAFGDLPRVIARQASQRSDIPERLFRVRDLGAT